MLKTKGTQITQIQQIFANFFCDYLQNRCHLCSILIN